MSASTCCSTRRTTISCSSACPTSRCSRSVATGETIINFWYHSADAISAQLEAARDGLVPAGGEIGNLTGDGRFGGWVQVLAGNIERDATQSFTGGGGTTVFNTSYDQDFQGIQAGLDYQSGGTILGITFGARQVRRRVRRRASTAVDLDGTNVGAYAAFSSGRLLLQRASPRSTGSMSSSTPGAGLATEFDATAWGLRGTAGFRFDMRQRLYRAVGQPVLGQCRHRRLYQRRRDRGVRRHHQPARRARASASAATSRRATAPSRPSSASLCGRGVRGRRQQQLHAGPDDRARTQDAPGTFGELSAGLNYSTGRLEAFVRGELDFGGERDGLSGRAGLRLRF